MFVQSLDLNGPKRTVFEKKVLECLGDTCNELRHTEESSLSAFVFPYMVNKIAINHEGFWHEIVGVYVLEARVEEAAEDGHQEMLILVGDDASGNATMFTLLDEIGEYDWVVAGDINVYYAVPSMVAKLELFGQEQ